MKTILKKAVIPAIALSMVFIVPARAVEPPASGQAEAQQRQTPSREMAFQIPMNSYCSAENSLDFSFQLSNAADTAADLTVRFYNLDGTAFNAEGSSYREIQSSIVPGTAFRLKANATGTYHINFGNHKSCSERVYLGKITVNSGQASLLARGWVNANGTNGANGIVEQVTVNDNKAFHLATPPAGAGLGEP
ncbi:hypothetical protein [Paenibacillus piri]|uniref:Uncharacterized protein n=1 Tax=Paenibacillus piri TaxID=2547395 RepID=A0A4R5KY81_9BACL|nr:hypothetical protein [Paenibacillus piri]TDG00189.1 hypothetical protein E1757_00650 [Paenibacillus piri]